jgi:hypothetical protein
MEYVKFAGMSRDKLNQRTDAILSAWARGRYPSALVPSYCFRDKDFKKWALDVVGKLRPTLDDLHVKNNLPPQLIMNVIATYRRMLVKKTSDKALHRKDLISRKQDSIALLRAAKIIDKHRKEVRFLIGGTNASDSDLQLLMVIPGYLREWTEMVQSRHVLRPLESCALILVDLFRRHGVTPIWEVAKDIIDTGFPREYFSGDSDSIRKKVARWELRIDKSTDDLFACPPKDPLEAILGRPSARQRLLLLKPTLRGR